MSKKLIIAEKPSVATDIARALGGFTRKGDYFESDDYVLSSAVGHLLELAVPFASARLAPGDTVALLVQALRGGQPVESYPGEEGLSFKVPGPNFEAEMWSA